MYELVKMLMATDLGTSYIILVCVFENNDQIGMLK